MKILFDELKDLKTQLKENEKQKEQEQLKSKQREKEKKLQEEFESYMKHSLVKKINK